MSEWTPEEVRAIGDVEEVRVAPLAGDGTPLQSVTMWAVTNGSEVFVRSVRGTKARWYRRVTETGRAVFEAADISREVAFEQVNEIKNQAVTDAYNTKYARYGRERQAMVEGDSVAATLRVVPV